MKTFFPETISSPLCCLHSWVVLSNAICWQKYRQVNHTMQKLRRKINSHVKDKLKAKDPSVKGMKLIFRERMHEKCKNVCLIIWNSLSLRHLIMLNSLGWIFLSKFFCGINVFDLDKSGCNLGESVIPSASCATEYHTVIVCVKNNAFSRFYSYYFLALQPPGPFLSETVTTQSFMNFRNISKTLHHLEVIHT